MKKNLLLLVVLILLLVIAYFLTKPLYKNVKQTVYIPAFNTSNVYSLSITKGPQTLILKKKGDIWESEGEENFLIDTEKVNMMVEVLRKLRFDDVISRNQSKYPAFGIDIPNVTIVEIKASGNISENIFIGKYNPVTNLTFVRHDPDPGVYQEPDNILLLFPTDTSELIVRNPGTIRPENVGTINIHTAEKDSLYHKDVSGNWFSQDGIDNHEFITKMLNAINNSYAEKQLTKTQREMTTKASQPLYTINFIMNDDNTHDYRLYESSEDPGKSFVQIDEQPYMYQLSLPMTDIIPAIEKLSHGQDDQQQKNATKKKFRNVP